MPQPYIYLDNASSSFPKPPCVIQAVSEYLTHGVNAGRGTHALAIESARILYQARSALATLLGQSDERRVIFAPNATYALNTALYGILKEGDRVLSTQLEHNSILRPLQHLQQSRGIRLKLLEASETCTIALDTLARKLEGARAFICAQSNNVSGSCLPVRDIYELTQRKGVLLIVDVAQAAGHLDLSGHYGDVLCGSCHKGLYAPNALGFLSLSPRFDEALMESLIQGGSGSASEELLQPSTLPDKFESGTPNMCAIAGLRASLEWLAHEGIDTLQTRALDLRARLIEGMRAIEGLRLYEITSKDRVGIVSFNFASLSPQEAGMRLEREYGILTRTGLHCAPLTHRAMGSFERGGSVRLSLGAFNTPDEIEHTLHAIRAIAANCR